MTNECDNKSQTHNPRTIIENDEVVRVVCTNCWNQYIIRKDWRGAPEKRLYAKIFKRDILQGNDNLLYRYHPEFLKR